MGKKLFEIGELKPKLTEQLGEKAAAKAASFLKSHALKVESIKNLVGRLPEENEIFFIWTLKSFNAFTFIPYLIKYAGIIDELIITTYSINTRIVDALMRLVDSGRIKKVVLYISESMKFRMPKVVDHLNSLISHRPQLSVQYSWVHAKIALVRIGDSCYSIEGSGNWAENAKHEQYIFHRSKDIFDFRKNWIENDIGS